MRLLVSHLGPWPIDQVEAPSCATLVIDYVALGSMCPHFVEELVGLGSK